MHECFPCFKGRNRLVSHSKRVHRIWATLYMSVPISKHAACLKKIPFPYASRCTHRPLTTQLSEDNASFDSPPPPNLYGIVLFLVKRERLFGTGSSTNAYTDFHHTVFYASCPVLTPPGWGRPTPMLGRALGALLDVLEVKEAVVVVDMIAPFCKKSDLDSPHHHVAFHVL